MGLMDIWDSVVDGFDYFIHFDWIHDIGDFFSGFFENIKEFSLMGLIGGGVMIFLTNLALKKIEYLQVLTGPSKIIQFGIFYVVAFVMGYLMVGRATRM